MPKITERLGSGWLALEATKPGSSEPDVLHLKMYAKSPYVVGIHVPSRIMGLAGELLAIVHGTGERISLGEGIVEPRDRGIRIVAPEMPTKSRLRTYLVDDIGRMVELRFVTDT